MNPWQQPSGQQGWGTPPGQGPYGAAFGGSPFGEPSAPPQASGATAITAAVLSFLGAITHGLGAIGSIWALFMAFDADLKIGSGMFVFLGLLSTAVAAALVIGGIMLLRRRLVGRIIIAAGCGGAILLAMSSLVYAESVMSSYGLHEYGYSVYNFAGGGGFGLVGHVVMAGITIALALVPSTTRWCLSGPVKFPPAPPGPMPYQPPSPW